MRGHFRCHECQRCIHVFLYGLLYFASLVCRKVWTVALPHSLLGPHPWATMMAAASQAQAQVQAAHAQAAANAQAAHAAAQQAHLQTHMHQAHHHHPHAQPHKQHIITEEKLQEKGETITSLRITLVPQVRLWVFPFTSCLLHYLLFQFIIILLFSIVELLTALNHNLQNPNSIMEGIWWLQVISFWDAVQLSLVDAYQSSGKACSFIFSIEGQ